MRFGYGRLGHGWAAARYTSLLLAAVFLLAPLANAQVNSEPGNSTAASSPAAQIRYTIDVVEMPTDKANPILNQWQFLGGQVSEVMPNSNSSGLLKSSLMDDSSKPRVSGHAFKISPVLSDEQIQQLLELGTVTASPELIGEIGDWVNAPLGRDLEFVVSYAPEKDENGRATGRIVPITVTLHDGLVLEFSGALDDQQTSVALQFKVTQSHFERLEHYTLELPDGPRTVDQPVFWSYGNQNRCRVPLHKTVALAVGPVVRESSVQKPIPLLGQLPWVGKSLEYTSKSVESVTTVILVRCLSTTGQTLTNDTLRTIENNLVYDMILPLNAEAIRAADNRKTLPGSGTADNVSR